MADDDRLAKVLARQSAAAEKRKLDEKAATKAAIEQEAMAKKVRSAWAEKRKRIVEYIDSLNTKMKQNDVALYVHPEGQHTYRHIEVMAIGFTPHARSTSDLQKLQFYVEESGTVRVRVSTTQHSPVKSYDLDVFSDDDAAFQNAVLDFVEVNI